MRKMKKVLALTACAAMLVTASVMGTIAYLTSSDSVQNTFTVGEVEITLAETKVDEYGKALTGDDAGTTPDGNKYKLIPGQTYTKDPTITVGDGSEDCWLFVKVENGLGTDATIDGWESDWEQIGTTNYWGCSTMAEAGDTVTAFTSFTFDGSADPTKYEKSNITITAYAIQADNVTYADAWTKISDQLDLE